MKSFYEHLADGNSKSEALRQAKLDFINNYSANPYYWSAFVLSGNISAVDIKSASSFGPIQIILAALFLIGVYYLIQRLRIRNKNP